MTKHTLILLALFLSLLGCDMAKPTDSETFATDATFAADGDAWSGDPVRVDPGVARRDEGFEPDLLPAEWINHEIGVHGDHIEYIHDVLNATDIIPAVARTIIVGPLRLNHQSPDWDVEAVSRSNLIAVTASAFASMDLSRFVPTGATITLVRAMIFSGSGARAPGSRWSMRLDTMTPNYTTPAIGAVTLVASDEDDGTLSSQLLTTGAISLAMSAGDHVILSFKAPTPVVNPTDQVQSIEITFTDPGPRNF